MLLLFVVVFFIIINFILYPAIYIIIMLFQFSIFNKKKNQEYKRRLMLKSIFCLRRKVY